MYLGYPLKYNGHEYSKVFDLVSWIISAIPYIAIPAAAMHSCGLYEGSCKEVSNDLKGMGYKWLGGFKDGAFNLYSAIQSLKVNEIWIILHCCVSSTVKNILHGQKHVDFLFWMFEKRIVMIVSNKKYLLYYVSNHRWISVKSFPGLISTKNMIMTPNICMITIVSLIEKS